MRFSAAPRVYVTPEQVTRDVFAAQATWPKIKDVKLPAAVVDPSNQHASMLKKAGVNAAPGSTQPSLLVDRLLH